MTVYHTYHGEIVVSDGKVCWSSSFVCDNSTERFRVRISIAKSGFWVRNINKTDVQSQMTPTAHPPHREKISQRFECQKKQSAAAANSTTASSLLLLQRDHPLRRQQLQPQLQQRRRIPSIIENHG